MVVDDRVGLLQNNQSSHSSANGGNENDLDSLELLLVRRENGWSDGKNFMATLSDCHKAFIHQRPIQVSSTSTNFPNYFQHFTIF